MREWEEKISTGEVVGRDPRNMTTTELKAIGQQPRTVMEALRARCIECCSGSAQEVRYCVAFKCPSWPFRMGKNPWVEKRVLSEEHKAKAAEALAKARTNRRVPVKE